MKLRIDPEFKSLIPPLTPTEREHLRDALIAAGRARDPITVWGDTIVDGHNRYELCTGLGLPFDVRSHEFADRTAVKAWMCAHQIGRRNLSVDQQVMVMLTAGVPLPDLLGSPGLRRQASDLVGHPRAADVVSGRHRVIVAHRLAFPEKHVRAPRGPSGKHAESPPPNIATGQELKEQSTYTNAEGELIGRWDKTRQAAADEPRFEPVPEGHLIRKISSYLGADGTVRGQHISSSPDEAAREAAMHAAWARHASLYAGLAGTAAPPGHSDAQTITLYPLGDPHVGMLSWGPETGDHFDVEIACRELLATVRALAAAAPPSKHAIVCNLGDFLHAQDDAALTPGHGNKLDVDGRFAKVLDAGHVLLRGIVDAALERHEQVTVRNLPGNHDPRVAAELAMWLRAVYEREPRVQIADAFAAHQYDRFGSNLFGWHHGDRSKATELPAIMATDRAADWGQTTERVWHVGHVHHLTRVETPGCVVETHRTMAGRDAWHAGRYRAGRSLCAITYHETFGEVARATRNLAFVRRGGA